MLHRRIIGIKKWGGNSGIQKGINYVPHKYKEKDVINVNINNKF